MRLAIFFLIILFTLTAATAQNKPTIIGQKELSTDQGKSITIELTDLYVQETTDQGGNDGNGGNGNNGGGNENDGDDDDDSGNNDNEDNEDDSGEDDSDDGDDKDDKGKDKGKGKGGDKNDDKGKDKDPKKDKDKDNKGKGKNKGGGNGRSSYPEGYALEIFQGSNYTFTGNTVIPASSFSGTLSVSVKVKNAQHASPAYDLIIQVKAVTPQNVAPVITGQSTLRTAMDKAIPINLSDIQVEDPDDQYPQGFVLKVRDGDNYEIDAGNTVVPATGFTGDLIVPVVVNDGNSDSRPFDLRITVAAPAAPANVAPKITGQLPIRISRNQSVKIILTHLLVTDPDNDYPEDFVLKVHSGAGYTIDNTTVTPADNYQGTLSVKVSVSDGIAESAGFNLSITVDAAANKKPIITGQVGVRITQGQSFVVKLSHLVVDDEDDVYPDDFDVSIQPGENYSFSNKTVTPTTGFLGVLNIPVTVHDGTTASDPFVFRVEVVPKDILAIVGQGNLEMFEDSLLALDLNDLLVNDPQGVYPHGFTMSLGTGANYHVEGTSIKPARNYFGNLTVPVTVSHNGVHSDPFQLLIVVKAVNDAPELLNVAQEPVTVSAGLSFPVFNDTDVVDEDDGHLLFAEVSIREGYTQGNDRIEYETSDSLHVIFDQETGILFMVGRASLQLYQHLIRSIKYKAENQTDSVGGSGSKVVSIELNDGKNTSARYDRMLRFETDLPLEIPTAFTPNNDNANDTWKITALGTIELAHAAIRVYDKKGLLVFESTALDREWDGHFNGSPLPADVYYYTIELDLTYKKLNFKGIVAILR